MKRMTMTPTVSRGRDRAGHGAAAVLLALACWLLPVAASAQGRPGAYKAQHFDVVITPRNGDLDVTETITFEFQSGTFRRVWRDLPTSRTDGIDIAEARMDGVVFPRGEGPGRVEVSGSGKVRVEWNFAPVGPSVHTLELRYVARGVAYREGNTDVVRWRALPSEHRYAIDESRITVQTADGTVRAGEFRHVQSISATTPGSEGTTIVARGVDANGWLIVDVRAPAGRLIAAPPQWQQRRDHADALAPRWIGAAGVVLALGVFFVVSMRQGYPAPSVQPGDTTTTSPPAPLPAALAAVLAANGARTSYRSIGTLLDLADRGVLLVRERPRALGTRQYEIEQVAGRHDLVPHEEEVLRIAFDGRREPVALPKARGRLARAARRFNAALNADLEARQLIDPARRAARDRFMRTSLAMLVIGAASFIGAAAFAPRFGGWPFLLPAALVVAAIVGLVMAASMTPLSDMGLIEAARWRGFKRHLKSLADPRAARAVDIDSRWIVYGIATGLATQWSRYLKKHPGVAPAWFVPATREDNGAFAAFVASNAATSGGHGGGGAGGGAAGGGGSGAG